MPSDKQTGKPTWTPRYREYRACKWMAWQHVNTDKAVGLMQESKLWHGSTKPAKTRRRLVANRAKGQPRNQRKKKLAVRQTKSNNFDHACQK